jgi:hypothetical protein
MHHYLMALPGPPPCRASRGARCASFKHRLHPRFASLHCCPLASFVCGGCAVTKPQPFRWIPATFLLAFCQTPGLPSASPAPHTHPPSFPFPLSLLTTSLFFLVLPAVP